MTNLKQTLQKIVEDWKTIAPKYRTPEKLVQMTLNEIEKRLEGERKEPALRLNTFKEGSKDGFNKGIDTALSIIKEVRGEEL